jgi:hypothetical protein
MCDVASFVSTSFFGVAEVVRALYCWKLVQDHEGALGWWGKGVCRRVVVSIGGDIATRFVCLLECSRFKDDAGGFGCFRFFGGRRLFLDDGSYDGIQGMGFRSFHHSSGK